MNTILYFTADWCNPCKKVKPIAEELIRDGANIKFIDVDVEIEMAKNFEIMSVPTFVVMRDNTEIHRASGALTMQELNNLIKYEPSNPVLSIDSLSNSDTLTVLPKEEKNENFIIYFTADWCQPCRFTTPIVEALNLESKTPKFFIVDTDEATQMKEDFDLLGVPTFVFIKNGEEVRRERGLQRKENLIEFLNYLEQ